MVAIRNCKFLLAVTGWADSEGNEHSSRSCKIAALGIGGKGMASPGGLTGCVDLNREINLANVCQALFLRSIIEKRAQKVNPPDCGLKKFVYK